MRQSVITCLFQGDPAKMPNYSSGKYSPAWVDRLAAAVARYSDAEFHVMQDEDYLYNGDFRTHRLIDPGLGWMNIMEVFRPELDLGHCLVIGLDTVITGQLDELYCLNAELVMPRDTEDKNTVNDGVILFAPAAGERIWEAYMDRGPAELERYRYGGYLSEMLLLRELWEAQPEKEREVFDHRLPGQVVSFKKDLGGDPENVPHNTRVVYFHGYPKPQDLPAGSMLRRFWN